MFRSQEAEGTRNIVVLMVLLAAIVVMPGAVRAQEQCQPELKIISPRDGETICGRTCINFEVSSGAGHPEILTYGVTITITFYNPTTYAQNTVSLTEQKDWFYRRPRIVGSWEFNSNSYQTFQGGSSVRITVAVDVRYTNERVEQNVTAQINNNFGEYLYSVDTEGTLCIYYTKHYLPYALSPSAAITSPTESTPAGVSADYKLGGPVTFSVTVYDMAEAGVYLRQVGKTDCPQLEHSFIYITEMMHYTPLDEISLVDENGEVLDSKIIRIQCGDRYSYDASKNWYTYGVVFEGMSTFGYRDGWHYFYAIARFLDYNTTSKIANYYIYNPVEKPGWMVPGFDITVALAAIAVVLLTIGTRRNEQCQD